MQPETVEIKATLARDQVAPAMASLGLSGGKSWRVIFCEDLTLGVGPVTPLLEIGVILRVRAKSGKKGDSTVKLRPCRWSQLTPDHDHNQESGDRELTIEADWTPTNRSLAAAMTVDWEDDRLSPVPQSPAVADLFSPAQRAFLADCARERVNLATITALDAIAATRFDPFPVTHEGTELSVRAERWHLDDEIDFLELSLVSSLAGAPAAQAALAGLLAARGLTLDATPGNKTQRVLAHLVAARLAASDG